MEIFICIALGYLLGSFQSSYILGKLFKKVDIRNFGFGNAGASNAVVTFGWKFGVLVAFLDILKAIFSILIIRFLFSSYNVKYFTFFLFLNCIFIIIGHDYPFYMKFKGGKGTASLVGALIFLDIKIAIVGIIAIILFTIVTNYIAIGTMALVSSLVLSTIFFNYSFPCIAISILIALLSLIKHLPNMQRIFKGTETRLKETI